MPRDCPVCGLVNPDTAPSCDCGFNFAYANTVGRVQLGGAARRNMTVGGLVCFVGLALTLLTLAVSTVTGVYVFAWGAIIWGATQFVRGLIQLGKERRIATREFNAEPGTAADRPRE